MSTTKDYTFLFPWLTISTDASRLGKICDWTQNSTSNMDEQNKFEKRKIRFATTSTSVNDAAYGSLSQDDSNFSLVDRAGSTRKASTRPTKQNFKKDIPVDSKNPLVKRVFVERNQKPRELSIPIAQTWTLLEEVDHSRLMKLSYKIGEPTELYVFNSHYFRLWPSDDFNLT